jgi:hypothetical protein
MIMTELLRVPDVGVDDDPLSAALAYAAAGWFVVPVKRGTKHPGSVLGNDWQTQSSRDPQQIAAWFAGEDHGVALHVGRSGAVAFDGDHPELLGGTALLQAIVDRQPPQQRTRPAEGRCHWLFLQPSDRVVGNGGAGPWGDVRGANGVIIAAPSVHPDPRGRYEWLRTGPVPPMPDYLAATLPDAAPGELPATWEECAEFAGAHDDGRRLDLLNRIMTTIDAELPTSARHPLFVGWTATAMREAAAGLYPAQLALETLHRRFAVAEGQGDGRIRTAAEQGREWQGIASWAIGQAMAADPADTLDRVAELDGPPLLFNGQAPRRVDPPERHVGAPEDGDLRAEQPPGVAEDTPEAIDPVERLIRAELVKLRVRAEARHRFAAEQLAALGPALLDYGTPAAILARPPEPPSRVAGLLGWEASTLITAQRKTGKTTLTLNLARSLLTGQPFLGRDVVPVTGRVTLLNFEVSARQIATWASDCGIVDDRFLLVNLRGGGNPFLPGDELAAMLVDVLVDTETLIVDPFGAAFTGDNENDAGQVRRWLGIVERFARTQLGARDLIVTAHSGKSKEGGARGSSVLEDWPDTIIRLTNDDDMRGISAIGRDVELPTHELRYDSLTRVMSLGEPVEAAAERRTVTAMIGRAVEAVEAWPGCSANELYRRIVEAGQGANRNGFLDALRQAGGQGLVWVEMDGRSAVYRPRNRGEKS